MRKQHLKEIPLPTADMEQVHEAAVKGKDTHGVIVTQRKRADGCNTLVLNVYQISGRNKRDISLEFRVFCQKEDFITLDMESGKWRTGALINLICRETGWSSYWWSYEQLEFASDADAEKAKNTLQRWVSRESRNEDRTAFSYLDQYQENVKAARLAKKHKKETDVIDAEMEQFGELPDDYQTFVEETVFKNENYIFYSLPKKRAYCTSCKNTFILDNKHLRHATIGVWNSRDIVKHNCTVCCPYCGKFLKAKSEGISRMQLFSVEWSVLVQPCGEKVLVRYFCHTKDFRTSFIKPKIETHEGYRTVHTADGVKDYMWDRYKMTDDVRWCYYHDRACSWIPVSETVAPRGRITLYNCTLQEAVDGTCMKYSVPDIFIENVVEGCGREHGYNTPWLVDNYFNFYRKHPYIEQLLKVGFYKMADELMDSYHYESFHMNEGQSTILATLGINKNQFRMLRRVGNPGMRDLQILQYKPDLKWEEYEILRYVRDDGWADMWKKYIDFMQYTTIYKLDKYINSQKIAHQNDYFDYAGWLEKMGYDMRNEFNLFPKNFKQAHDEKSREYVRFKDRQAREDTKRFNCVLKKLRKDTAGVDAMNLNIAGLFIRLPNKLEELKTEGEALHHCVATYMEKVRKGETMIFFIRQKSAPEKPYYTLEWHGRVIQCRGSNNCDMTPEVKAFVQIFQEKMTEYEKTPPKQRKAG